MRCIHYIQHWWGHLFLDEKMLRWWGSGLIACHTTCAKIVSVAHDVNRVNALSYKPGQGSFKPAMNIRDWIYAVARYTIIHILTPSHKGKAISIVHASKRKILFLESGVGFLNMCVPNPLTHKYTKKNMRAAKKPNFFPLPPPLYLKKVKARWLYGL